MHSVHYRLSVRWLQETKIVNLTPHMTSAGLAKGRGDTGKSRKYCSRLRKVQVKHHGSWSRYVRCTNVAAVRHGEPSQLLFLVCLWLVVFFSFSCMQKL